MSAAEKLTPVTDLVILEKEEKIEAPETPKNDNAWLKDRWTGFVDFLKKQGIVTRRLEKEVVVELLQVFFMYAAAMKLGPFIDTPLSWDLAYKQLWLAIIAGGVRFGGEALMQEVTDTEHWKGEAMLNGTIVFFIVSFALHNREYSPAVLLTLAAVTTPMISAANWHLESILSRLEKIGQILAPIAMVPLFVVSELAERAYKYKNWRTIKKEILELQTYDFEHAEQVILEEYTFEEAHHYQNKLKENIIRLREYLDSFTGELRRNLEYVLEKLEILVRATETRKPIALREKYSFESRSASSTQ